MKIPEKQELMIKHYFISITAEIQTVEEICKHLNKWASLVLIEAPMKYASLKLLNVMVIDVVLSSYFILLLSGDEFLPILSTDPSKSLSQWDCLIS